MLKSILAATCAAALVNANPVLARHHEAADEATTLSAPKIEYTRWVLDNGLQVIAIQDNSTANVTTSLWYEVGAKNDPDGRSGFAHLFEHILSRKTVNMPYNMINGLTEDVGGVRNASTGTDRTNYYETVPAQYLETMLWTHRERMAYPVVDAEVFEKERSVVKEELRQRVLAPPYGRLFRFVVAENAYDTLPMRRPGIGSIEDLDAATLDDARAFHQAFYGPDTATLIVAGNFEMPRLHALVDQYFTDIPRRANPISVVVTGEERLRTQPRTVHATAPNVPLPVVAALWQAPDITHPDAAPLEVLSTIMSRGDNSRLHDALVRSGKAVDAGQGEDLGENGGFLYSFAILSPTADMDEAAALMDTVMEQMRSERVSDAELREAKSEIFASALSQRQTAQGRAFELGEALVSTGDPDAADKRLEAIAAVTAADVQRVAQAWLRPDGKVALTYTAGEDDPAAYANPVPMPKFGRVPPATGEPRQVLAEGERMAPPAPGAVPEVVRAPFVDTTLDNGITLVSAQTSDVPIVTISLVFSGGDATDPAGKAGVAGLAASVADKGTPTRSATQIAAALESLGASLGIGASADGTVVSLTAPTVNLAEAGGIMVDVIQHASFPDAELELERKRALDGLLAGMKDPGELANMVATRILYGDAPYGQVANPDSLSAITAADLLTHRQTYWHPASAKIVVSGGIDAGAARDLANDLLGGWTSGVSAPQLVTKPAGVDVPLRTIVVDMPDAGQAAVIAGMRTLARQDADFYNLWLANTVLGSGSNGRLFEEVRTKRALSYGAYSSLSQRSDIATLTANAQTKNETADEVATIFLDQFAKLASDPLSEDALEKRRLYLGGALARSLETSSGFNGQVASLMLRGIEPEEALRTAERLSAVSVSDAAEAAARYVDPKRASLVVVGDAQYFLDDLKALRGEVEVIPVDQLDLSRADLIRPAVEE